MASPIYAHPWLMEAALRIKYGRWYLPRLERVAREICAGDRVVDLCCGDAALYRRLLARRGVAYRGVEMNPHMARALRRRSVIVDQADVRTYELPPCEVVLCLASLYQFPRQVEGIIRSAHKVAGKIVLLEPVENMAASGSLFSSLIGRHITDYGEGPVTFRYDEPGIRALWERLGVTHMERIGPELLGIWDQENPKSPIPNPQS